LVLSASTPELGVTAPRGPNGGWLATARKRGGKSPNNCTTERKEQSQDNPKALRNLKERGPTLSKGVAALYSGPRNLGNSSITRRKIILKSVQGTKSPPPRSFV